MKRIIILTGAVVSFALMAFTAIMFHVDVYKVDTSATQLEWYAEKLTGKHNGVIKVYSGEIQNNHGSITGTFQIDMNSIENKDLQDEKLRTKLENHLKASDFFDAENYPKTTFTITSITPVTEASDAGFTHNVKGNLTIKDKSNEISFPAIINISGNKATCIGSAIVDRSKFDVKYGSKSFFADIGDNLIYDEFTIKFNVVAVK